MRKEAPGHLEEGSLSISHHHCLLPKLEAVAWHRHTAVACMYTKLKASRTYKCVHIYFCCGWLYYNMYSKMADKLTFDL